jgi:hypothetical protein
MEVPRSKYFKPAREVVTIGAAGFRMATETKKEMEALMSAFYDRLIHCHLHLASWFFGRWDWMRKTVILK